MEGIGDHLNKIERNIEIVSKDPLALHGFTQVPNFLFKPMETENGKEISLSLGSRFVYAKFLSYAWHNDYVFPGQQRLADDLGISVGRVNQFIKELNEAKLIEVTKRGQGKTNLYKVLFRVKPKGS